MTTTTLTFVEEGDVIAVELAGHGPRLGIVSNIDLVTVAARVTRVRDGFVTAFTGDDNVRVVVPAGAVTLLIPAAQVRAGWLYEANAAIAEASAR